MSLSTRIPTEHYQTKQLPTLSRLEHSTLGVGPPAREHVELRQRTRQGNAHAGGGQIRVIRRVG